MHHTPPMLVRRLIFAPCATEQSLCHRLLGGYSAGGPPLPIPNRVVKPRSADGTALRGGRVGRRRDLIKRPLSVWTAGAFFVAAPRTVPCSIYHGIPKRSTAESGRTYRTMGTTRAVSTCNNKPVRLKNDAIAPAYAHGSVRFGEEGPRMDGASGQATVVHES